jgi:hypothetical protein
MVLRRTALILVAAMTVSACGATHGPWTDPSGNLASSGIIVEYEGFQRCGTHDVVFIEYAGRTYANDPSGALGPLAAPSGQALTFNDQAQLPADAVASGYRHSFREVWVAQSDLEEYLYIVFDDERVERWPRAEIPCE